jgi:hypothetical protein
MGRPITGTWKQSTVPYTGAGRWGTGVHVIHSMYGSDNLRVVGRTPQGEVGRTPPSEAVPGFIEDPDWGYQPEDLAGLDVFADPEAAIKGIPFIQDGWPSLNQHTPQTRARTGTRSIYPVGSAGVISGKIRSLRFGPRDMDSEKSNQVPTETVSEGWKNKPHGRVANAVPSDPSQYEIQTSMAQRYQVRNNEHAVGRGTDEERTPIQSRVTGQKIKYYSGGERHYDMFPFQQDQMIRPFRYRTAGTGRPADMLPNEQWQITPIQRTPPPDPYLGPEETDDVFDFGYTAEDNFYA